MNNNSEWYIDFIKTELSKYENTGFTGNVEFRVNFQEGKIKNINNTLNRSIRKPER